MAPAQTKVAHSLKATVTRRLIELQDLGRLTDPEVAAAAESMGVSVRTVYRWVANADRTAERSVAWSPNQETIDTYVSFCGNASTTYRWLSSEGHDLPSLSTFRRGLNRALTPQQRAYARRGLPGARVATVYLCRPVSGRNDVWESDHLQLPVEVRVPRSTRLARPWLTSFIDDASRLVMGWALTMHPDTASILAALGGAIRRDPDLGFGGVPQVIRVDRGRDFLSHAIGDACNALGIVRFELPARRPNRKGKVERVHGTLISTLICGLPRFTEGPRDAAGRLYDTGPALTLANLQHLVGEWVESYNRDWQHSELGGSTPIDWWRKDAGPINIPDDRELDWMLLARKGRTITTWGIRHENRRYIAPDISGRVGDRVQIRFVPHDHRSVEVFEPTGEWIATAYPQQSLTYEQEERMRDAARQDAIDLTRLRNRANRRARRRYSPLGRGDAVEPLPLDRPAPAADRRSSEIPGLELLDLDDYLTVD